MGWWGMLQLCYPCTYEPRMGTLPTTPRSRLLLCRWRAVHPCAAGGVQLLRLHELGRHPVFEAYSHLTFQGSHSARQAHPSKAAPSACPPVQFTHLPFYDSPCRTSGIATLRQPKGTQPQCQPFSFTGRRRMSNCMAEAARLQDTLCVSALLGCAMGALESSSHTTCMWAVRSPAWPASPAPSQRRCPAAHHPTHPPVPCPAPLPPQYLELQEGSNTFWMLDHACSAPDTVYHAEPEACAAKCSYPELAPNRYCIHCAGPRAKPVICVAAGGTPCTAEFGVRRRRGEGEACPRGVAQLRWAERLRM